LLTDFCAGSVSPRLKGWQHEGYSRHFQSEQPLSRFNFAGAIEEIQTGGPNVRLTIRSEFADLSDYRTRLFFGKLVKARVADDTDEIGKIPHFQTENLRTGSSFVKSLNNSFCALDYCAFLRFRCRRRDENPWSSRALTRKAITRTGGWGAGRANYSSVDRFPKGLIRSPKLAHWMKLQ